MRVEWGVNKIDLDVLKITDAAGNIVRFTGDQAEWLKKAVASGESCCVFEPPKEEPKEEPAPEPEKKAPAKKKAAKKKKLF